jgi:hypothetical protein
MASPLYIFYVLYKENIQSLTQLRNSELTISSKTVFLGKILHFSLSTLEPQTVATLCKISTKVQFLGYVKKPTDNVGQIYFWSGFKQHWMTVCMSSFSTITSISTGYEIHVFITYLSPYRTYEHYIHCQGTKEHYGVTKSDP